MKCGVLQDRVALDIPGVSQNVSIAAAPNEAPGTAQEVSCWLTARRQDAGPHVESTVSRSACLASHSVRS